MIQVFESLIELIIAWTYFFNLNFLYSFVNTNWFHRAFLWIVFLYRKGRFGYVIWARSSGGLWSDSIMVSFDFRSKKKGIFRLSFVLCLIIFGLRKIFHKRLIVCRYDHVFEISKLIFTTFEQIIFVFQKLF